MSSKKKQIRKAFNEVCLERDKYKCRICSYKPEFTEELDVHHITDRSEMPNGGYVKENGISLCAKCHNKAERFHITGGLEWDYMMHPDDLYIIINSSYEEAVKASEKLG